MCYKKDLYLENLEWLQNNINNTNDIFHNPEYSNINKSIDEFIFKIYKDKSVNPFLFKSMIDKIYDNLYHEELINH